MDGIGSLIRPVLDSEYDHESLRNLLSSCIDQRSFTQCTSGIPSFVGLINGKCNEPATRYDGLLLLQTFLPQCQVDVLTQWAPSWFQFCLKGAAVGATAELSYVVLKMLFDASVSVPELSRHVSSIVIPNYAQLIHQGILPQAYVKALECLEVCMKNFNGPCGPHKKVFDNFLLSLLDYCGPNKYHVFWGVACCMALVPQTGGGGVGGVQYKVAWAEKQKQLCRTLHLILDDLYVDTNELQISLMGSKLEETEPLPLGLIDDSDPIQRIEKLANRLISVLDCLQAMLVRNYPVPKNVAVSTIMNLICRGLAVTVPSIGPCNTTNTLALRSKLPLMHYFLMKLLEAFVKLGRDNLLMFSGKICRLCIQTLKWTYVKDIPYGTERPYRILRCQAYAVLRIWCGTVKCGSGVEQMAQEFFDVSLHDVYSERSSVSLYAGLRQKNDNQRRSKGHKGATNPSVSGMSSNGSALDESANLEVCVAALKAFTSFVMAASSKIQASLYKTLQETVVAALLKATLKSNEIPIPYSKPSARLELYRLLLQLVLDGHPVSPSPTNWAIKLFSMGLHDSSTEISMFCGLAQSAVDKIIHPAHPSMHLVPSRSEVAASITSPQDTPATSESRVPVPMVCVSKATPRINKVEGTSTRTNSDSSPVFLGFKRSVSVENVHSTPIPVTDNSTQEDRNLLNSQSSPQLRKKVTEMEDENSQKPIDLTNSDASDGDDDDDEISEVPCEIDLADSEDEKACSDGEKSNVSICSQATVNTPITEEVERHLSELGLKDSAVAASLNGSVSNAVSIEADERNDVSVSKEAEVVERNDVSVSKEAEVDKRNDVSVAKEAEADKGIKVTTANPVANGSSAVDNKDCSGEAAKRSVEGEENEGSATKKVKLEDDDMEFPSDEDSMLLSFVDVTRDEENEEYV